MTNLSSMGKGDRETYLRYNSLKNQCCRKTECKSERKQIKIHAIAVTFKVREATTFSLSGIILRDL